MVELVLPNVLFCDNRDDDDDSEPKDVDNWNILFPSYIEECRENDRDAREDASRSGREGADVETEPLKKEDVSCKQAESTDDASISSTGWEDTVSESDSEDEHDKEKEAPAQHVDTQDVKPLETTISPLSDPDLSEKTIEAEEEEEVVEVQLSEPQKSPPPELLMPTLDEKKSVEAVQPEPDASSITDKVNPAESRRDRSNHLKRSTSAPSNGCRGLFSCAPLRRSASGPRSKSPSRSKSPRRLFVQRTQAKQPSTDQALEAPQNENSQDEPQNAISKENLAELPQEPTTSAVKEIDVLSNGSLDSNLTNPSMFSSIHASPPPSPPKGW
ncbi:MAG: hypothetical protein SGARI_006258, partial [Bacillariaceae sp.]